MGWRHFARVFRFFGFRSAAFYRILLWDNLLLLPGCGTMCLRTHAWRPLVGDASMKYQIPSCLAESSEKTINGSFAFSQRLSRLLSQAATRTTREVSISS